MISGRIDITDDIQIIQNIIFGTPEDKGVLIVNLDEDIRMEHPSVVGGGCLLPPPEALEAEINGDGALYDQIYTKWMFSSYVYQYMTVLITALYKGRNIIIYAPDLRNRESVTVSKLMMQFYENFGLKIGILNTNDQFQYNPAFIPIWCCMMLLIGSITPLEFLILYPVNTAINRFDVIQILFNELKPVEPTYEANLAWLYKRIAITKEKPNVIDVFYKA